MTDSFFMIGCEVGAEGPSDGRPLAIGRFLDASNYEVTLNKPGKFGTVAKILEQYGVDTKGFPDFIQNALKLEATIQELKYVSRGTIVTTDAAGKVLSAKDKQTNKEVALPASLTGAIIKVVTPGKSHAVEKDSKPITGYTVSKTGDNEYLFVKSTYAFAVVAQYDQALEIVPKLLAIKFLAFAITNDEEFRTKENGLEKLVTPALQASIAARLTGGPQAPKQLPD